MVSCTVLFMLDIGLQYVVNIAEYRTDSADHFIDTMTLNLSIPRMN